MFLFTRISKNTDFIFLTFHLYYQKMSFRLQLFFYKNIGYSKRDHTLVLSLYRFFTGPKCYNKSLLQRRNCMKYKTSFQVTGSFFLVLFFILGWIVKFHLSWLSGFDQWFTDIVRASYPNLNSYQLFMTKFGNPLTVIILFACTALWMWYKKKGQKQFGSFLDLL